MAKQVVFERLVHQDKGSIRAGRFQGAVSGKLSTDRRLVPLRPAQGRPFDRLKAGDNSGLDCSAAAPRRAVRMYVGGEKNP